MQVIERKLFGTPLSDFLATVHYSRRASCIWELISKDFADEQLDLERAARE